jgi:hypothetical protein
MRMMTSVIGQFSLQDVAEADGPVIETVIFMNIAEENFRSQFDLP